jgi:hypothetical protein
MITNGEQSTPSDATPVGPVAGETLKDAARWPGYTLIALGLLSFALTLTGFAVGRGDLAPIGVVVTIVALAAGIGWQFAERRRLRNKITDIVPERPEDVT